MKGTGTVTFSALVAPEAASLIMEVDVVEVVEVAAAQAKMFTKADTRSRATNDTHGLKGFSMISLYYPFPLLNGDHGRHSHIFTHTFLKYPILERAHVHRPPLFLHILAIELCHLLSAWVHASFQ